MQDQSMCQNCPHSSVRIFEESPEKGKIFILFIHDAQLSIYAHFCLSVMLLHPDQCHNEAETYPSYASTVVQRLEQARMNTYSGPLRHPVMEQNLPLSVDLFAIVYFFNFLGYAHITIIN